MGPKKKKGGKKKGKGGAGGDDDKGKKAIEEVESLKDQLAFRSDLTRKADELRRAATIHCDEERKKHEQQEADNKMVTSEIIRQYKTMNDKLALEKMEKEIELQQTRKSLENTEAELRRINQLASEMKEEKDQEINKLQTKLATIEHQYSQILQNALDDLMIKVDDEQQTWRQKSQIIQDRHKELLKLMGLRPLDM